jgi:hypothetical protein
MSLGSYWRNGRDKDQQAIAARHIGKKRKQKLAPPPRDIITIRTVTTNGSDDMMLIRSIMLSVIASENMTGANESS